MKKSNVKFDSKVISQIIEMVENGKTKLEVQTELVTILKVHEDPSRIHLIDKYIKHSDVKFKKSGGNWDTILDYFKECRESDSEPSKDEMEEKLRSDQGMTETQSKKYGSSYWYIVSEMYKI